MKTDVLFSVVLLFTFTQISLSQDIKGVKGNEIKPYIFNMKDIPSYGEIYLGGKIKEDFNEAEPPYSPPYPAPDAKDIQNMTYDLNSGNPSPFAPTTGTNFEGITQTNYAPGEPQLAAGPNNVFVLGNVFLRITNKSGGTLSNVLQSVFFNVPAAEGPGFDSKCFYDYRRGRFLALCETLNNDTNSTKNYYYLAISATSDAMGIWYIYKFDMTKDGSSQSTNWSDFPGLGISDDKIVMSGQQFTSPASPSSAWQYQKMRVIDRAAAYSGGTLPAYVDFYNWSGQQFVTKPGRNMSAGDDIYILSTLWNGGTTVQFKKITGNPSTPVLSASTNVNVSSYGEPTNAPGGSAALTINTGDCRTPDFFVRNGVLNIAFHIGATISGGAVTAIKFLRISVNPFNSIPLTDETYGAASTFYYYPMVCLDSAGTMFMGFGKSSTSEFPSSYVTGKRRGDASIQSSVLAKSGTVVTAQGRWGDYTGIDMDESASTPGASYSWYSGQYTKASNIFGTWVTQMHFTYGQISGTAYNDGDGDILTTNDRTGLSGIGVTLKLGGVVISTKNTDASGNYNFGYLETGTNYSVVFTQPTGRHSLDAIPGSGGTSQSKLDKKTLAVNLTNSQTSSSNNYICTDFFPTTISGNWDNPYIWLDSLGPSNVDKVLISPGTTVTVNGDYYCLSLIKKGSLVFDNVTPRTLNIYFDIILENGNITLGNNNIINLTSTGIVTASSSAYIVTNGSGTLTRNTVGAAMNLFPVGSSTAYNPVYIDNLGTADNFSVKVKNTFDNPPSTANILNKQWTITEAVPGGSNAFVFLQWNPSDESGTFIRTANLAIERYNGTNWVSSSCASVSGSGPYTTGAFGFTEFSPFTVGNQIGMSLTAIPGGFYDPVSNQLNSSDTVTALLRNTSTPYTIIDSAVSVIDAVTFNGLFMFSKANNGNYYIALKHRNSLETWSRLSQTFTAASNTNYNFTTDSAKAFGNNLVKSGTKWCLVGGDCNQDGYIDGSDYISVINHYDEAGYLAGDNNGDGYVDGSDYLPIINNYDRSTVTPLAPMNLSKKTIKKMFDKDKFLDSMKQKVKDM